MCRGRRRPRAAHVWPPGTRPWHAHVTRRRPRMSRFEGRTVVVTGAGGGIGKGIAARFAAEGARVVRADRSEAVVEPAAEVGGLGVQADITEPADVTRL